MPVSNYQAGCDHEARPDMDATSVNPPYGTQSLAESRVLCHGKDSVAPGPCGWVLPIHTAIVHSESRSVAKLNHGLQHVAIDGRRGALCVIPLSSRSGLEHQITLFSSQ